MPDTTHDIAALFAAAFRDFVHDGVIASGVYQPEKSLLRQLGAAIADALAAKASQDLASANAAGLLSPELAAKLVGIAEGANKYVHPATDGSRHLPVTGAGDTARWLKSGAAAGAMAQWAVISKADIGLGQADNTPDALKPISNLTQAALNAKEDKSGKGATGGYASLDAGGKIPSSQLPPVAISEPFVVESQAAMLALVAQTGDIAIRPDVSRTFVLREEPASVLGNWIELASPAQGVMTVNNKPGPNVSISKDDVDLGQADNTPDSEKPVSDPQQQALDAKADKAIKVTAGEGLSGGGDLGEDRTLSLSTATLAALDKANSAVQPSALGDLAEVKLPDEPSGRVLDDLGNWVPLDNHVDLTSEQTLEKKKLKLPVIEGYTEGHAAGSGTSFAPDLASGTLFHLQTTGNATISLPAATVGKSFSIAITYGGAHGIAWSGAARKWPKGEVPAPTSAAGKIDVFSFICLIAGTWLAFPSGQDF